MRDCTSSQLRKLRPASRTAYRGFRLLSPLLLLLGMLAGADLISLHAQDPRPLEKKTGEKRVEGKTEEKKETVRPAPRMSGGTLVTSTVPASARFQFQIDPNAPLKDFLPPPPQTERIMGSSQSNDLRAVPEVQFEALQGGNPAEAMNHIGRQIAKINQLNENKTDGFIQELGRERPDLTGLPFAMGDACRTTGERSKQFARAVATVRRALQSSPVSNVDRDKAMREEKRLIERAITIEEMQRRKVVVAEFAKASGVPSPPVSQAELPPPEHFWDQYQALCLHEDKEQKQADRAQPEAIILARIAALTQILLPMTQMHPGMAKYLSTVPHVEATRALARLAIFSADEDARKAAIEALKVRRERDYTEILVGGLRYPWPAVARRAAEAVVKLERNDLLSQLIDVLEQPDPRAPMTQEIKGKTLPVVRELVRVNHHRSCLLCHAPGNTGKVSADAVRAEVPVPGQPLNPPSGGYNVSRQEILVRVDVTYLRQDFSALLAVADANPWPEMQRFDFLVRMRELSDAEAATLREKLKPREPGEFSPYQRAALAALRELSGRDTEPTPEAWRRLLKLPAQTQRQSKSS